MSDEESFMRRIERRQIELSGDVMPEELMNDEELEIAAQKMRDKEKANRRLN